MPPRIYISAVGKGAFLVVMAKDDLTSLLGIHIVEA
jgi:hypothetical protein